MRTLTLILFGSMVIFAQPFSAGIKGGVPLTGLLSASQNIPLYVTSTQRYVIGGTAELHLPLGLGVEFDALYRHAQIIATSNSSKFGSGNWEFPLLIKYRFPFPVVRPFLDAGVSWNKITGVGAFDVEDSTPMGYVAGVGVDVHALVVHISPEIRYTRWRSRSLNVVQSTISVLQSNQNQAEFLVGITF